MTWAHRLSVIAIAVILVASQNMVRAGALEEFVRNFDFTRAETVEQLSYSDALVRSLHDAMGVGQVRCPPFAATG